MASSIEIEQMKQIQKVARAYFDAKEEDDRILAVRFFRSLDDNGDGKLSLEEYKRHVDPRFSSDHLFKLLDSNGDGTLELEEFLALYYMDNVLIPRCSACHVMLLGYSYFSCLPCLGHSSYHLCCSCYGAGSFDHSHQSTQFADTRALLKLFDRLMAEAEVATAQPDLPQEEVGRSSIGSKAKPLQSSPTLTRSKTTEMMQSGASTSKASNQLAIITPVRSKKEIILTKLALCATKTIIIKGIVTVAIVGGCCVM